MVSIMQAMRVGMVRNDVIHLCRMDTDGLLTIIKIVYYASDAK